MTRQILACAIVITLLTGCASVFVPRKQKVTINTNRSEATVYLNKEEFGSGASIRKKIKKDWTQEITVKADGYRDLHAVLVPTHRPVGYFICQVFNIPFDILYLAPLMWDNVQPQNLAYSSINTVPEMTKEVFKKPEDKFIDLNVIRLDIKNKDKDLATRYLSHSPQLLKSIETTEAEIASNTLKEEEKEKRKQEKQKSKKKSIAVPEDKKIVYDDTKFSTYLYKTLKRTGYVDTVNKIFSDNNNTMVLEAAINKAFYYYVRVPRDEDRTRYYKCRVHMTWYVKNTYNEILDSIVSTQYSDEFIADYGEKYADLNVRILQDAVEQSYISLHKNPDFLAHLKQQTDFTPKYTPLTLNSPKKIVTEKTSASGASVIIKTKKGHGSGFAITNDGYIVTNYHVVAGKIQNEKNKITVINANGDEVDAELVRYNQFRDIALLKVNKEFETAFKTTSVKSFKNMQDVYTIGAPKSIELGQSVSSGVISNERKSNNNNLLQLGMGVNSGNSGGPVFDANGNLHGVIVSKLVGQNTEGVSFAIPGYLIEDYLKISFN